VLDLRKESGKQVTPMDEKTTISDLRAAVAHFVDERNWEEYHSPKNLAMSIAIEAAEIMEHFQWLTKEESSEVTRSEECEEVIDELADVLIYCLSFVNQLDVDLSSAILDKLRQNENRYPVGYMPTK
jgi:dCTP diphosphatase